MPGIHANPSDVIDNSALATAWHVAGLPRVARESVPIATRLTTLFATLKCREGFAKGRKGLLLKFAQEENVWKGDMIFVIHFCYIFIIYFTFLYVFRDLLLVPKAGFFFLCKTV